MARKSCSFCETDLSTLKSLTVPSSEASWARLTVADLFSGCGGLSLGMQRAAHELGISVDVRLAVDSDPIAVSVYRNLFPASRSLCSPLEKILDGDLGTALSVSESDVALRTGPLDVLLGGPPCQGHSNLNNHSRRDDPRNGLYLRMARAAEVLSPSAIIIENVPTVTSDVRRAVHRTLKRLTEIGYAWGQGVIDLSLLGVPQKRRRHVIVAIRDYDVNPQQLIDDLKSPICVHVPRSVRWAIGDLEDVESNTPFDTASKPHRINQKRIDWLFENGEIDLPNELRPPCHRTDHSYKSMYGRMDWDSPAQTITTGFNSMGQGRYVHPSRRRYITPHEAARLQMLPDFVDFGSVSRRTKLAKLIGNTVPPPLTFALGKALVPLLMRFEVAGSGRKPMTHGTVNRES